MFYIQLTAGDCFKSSTVCRLDNKPFSSIEEAVSYWLAAIKADRRGLWPPNWSVVGADGSQVSLTNLGVTNEELT